MASAILLYRICYWQQYANVELGGYTWVAKSRNQWIEDTGLTLGQYRHGVSELVRKGYIRLKNSLRNGRKMGLIRLSNKGILFRKSDFGWGTYGAYTLINSKYPRPIWGQYRVHMGPIYKIEYSILYSIGDKRGDTSGHRPETARKKNSKKNFRVSGEKSNFTLAKEYYPRYIQKIRKSESQKIRKSEGQKIGEPWENMNTVAETLQNSKKKPSEKGGQSKFISIHLGSRPLEKLQGNIRFP